ncbi:hypothetical protein COLO4_15097 [Corchorus olitorius]|uniref:SHSP domain-containing protein n=1 Tax=Corchorus olitorius TaxID=93759 RepID=A0A1R3JPM1_9ROSI|nr:hypothetical protein COLO4_15097 [Corchorus olitorius]
MADEFRSLLPLTDLKITPTAWVAKADVPGFKKHEITVEIEDSTFGKVLHVRGQKKNNSGWESDTLNHRERPLGDFSRSYRLIGTTFDLDAATAKMEDGVLTITVPMVCTGIRRLLISD